MFRDGMLAGKFDYTTYYEASTYENLVLIAVSSSEGPGESHTGKCICQFAGIYAYCWYFIERKW